LSWGGGGGIKSGTQWGPHSKKTGGWAPGPGGTAGGRKGLGFFYPPGLFFFQRGREGFRGPNIAPGGEVWTSGLFSGRAPSSGKKGLGQWALRKKNQKSGGGEQIPLRGGGGTGGFNPGGNPGEEKFYLGGPFSYLGIFGLLGFDYGSNLCPGFCTGGR